MTRSLTYCVLYLVFELGNNWRPLIRLNLGSDASTELDDRFELWRLFLKKFGGDIKKATKDRSHVLCAAIRMGHEWDPILRDIIQQDPCALDGTDTSTSSPPLCKLLCPATP
jgi:hypothetical protein